ncbi:MAG: PAS domain S-box protein, partial [Acidobacteria bacterium]|nr:PAS domain S-box protein [Acidobacteriota bacterium]
AFLDHSPDNIYFKDRESRFLRISRAMASYFGLKDAADIVGKTDFDFFARAHAEPAFQDEQTIIQTGRAIEGKEEKEVWPDGRVTWVSTTKIALRDAAGQIIGTFGISHDITSQKRAEQTLQDANLELELRVQSRTNELALSNQILQADIDERERVEKRQSALFRISEAAQSAPSLEKLCRAVHGIIGELMPAKNMYFALYDKAKDIIHFPYCVDERDPVRPDRKFGKGLTEYVLRTGKPLLASPGIHQQLREKGDVVQLGTPSVDWLGVPLTTHEGTIGVLCVQTYTEGLRYGDAEKDILLFVSSQIASAIERKQAEDALRRNEERFRALVENSSDAIWLLGKDGTVLYASQSSEDVTGFQRGEVVGLNLFHPDELGMIREKIGQILAQPGVAVPVEHRLRHKNGFWRQVQSVGVNRLPDPSVGAIVVNIRDVTEQRRGERVQRAIYQISEAANSAKTLDELLHSTHEVVCELMPATNFYVALYDEAAGLLTFQYFVDEVDPTPAPKKLGRGLTEYVLHSGKPLLASPEVFEELVRKGNVEMIGGPSIDWLGVPLRTSEKAFGVLVVQSYTEGVRYTEEHKEILVFVSTQVAAAIERKRAEEADRRNEERFRALVEHSSDVVALISREGKFIYCSRAVERVMGYTPEDRIGKSGFDNVHPDDLPGIRASFMQCLQQPGIPIPGEYRARHNNGSWRYLEGVSVNRLEDPAVGAIVLNYRDVTGRKNAEQAIRASEERYRIFFESNPHPMWVYDSDSQIILAVNESAIEHYGYSRSEFLAMTVADLHPEEDALARATAGDAEGKTHR